VSKWIISSIIVISFLTLGISIHNKLSIPTPITAPKLSEPLGAWEVTYTITYNDITLEKAGDVERKLKTLFGDACKIEVSQLKQYDVEWDYTGRDSVQIFYQNLDSVHIQYFGVKP